MLTNDNFRKYRRLLQGRGVNLRMGKASAVSATTVTVPGLRKEDEIIGVMAWELTAAPGSVTEGVVKGAVAASLNVVPAGVNNDVTFTARKAGLDGNNLQIQYTDPAAASQPLTVVVSFDATNGKTLINFLLETNGASAIVTTGNQIIGAIRTQLGGFAGAAQAGLPTAGQLVSAANSAANDGTGVVTAIAKTSLAGGADNGRTDGTADSVTIQGSLYTRRLTSDRYAGDSAYDISVKYTDPAAASQVLHQRVTRDPVTGDVTIDIRLATDGASVITTTRDQIRQLITDSYRQVTVNAGDDGQAGGPYGGADFVIAGAPAAGATLATAVGATALTGGNDSGSFLTTADLSLFEAVLVWWVSARD